MLPVPDNKPESYNQILKSTSVIGSAAGVNLLLSLLRMKFAALFIGPVGVGLVGTYQVIQGMVGTVAGLGLQQSAVRDIVEAVGKGDDDAIGRFILSLRRICWLTGLIGMIAMVALAAPLGKYTFDSTDYTLDIALLGPIIFLANVQAGQAAILQGMRRIGDLARLNVIGAAVGTVVAVALYAWLGVRGIIPSLLLIALIQLLVTWYFSMRVTVPAVELSWKESFQAADAMIRLGVVFMWNGLLIALVAYLTRSWITQELDLVAVCIFTAAFSLSGMFINFILGAMGADYYPRLTEASHDHGAMGRLVNEQTEIGLLLAVPGLLATLTLAPWIISLFFTREFLPAAGLLQWFILGCLGRVISWPLGFVMLALGKARWFFITETSANFLHLLMIWLGLAVLGLEGVAIAFFCLYVFYIAAVYGLARHLIGFSWAGTTLRLLYIFLPIMIGAFFFGRLLALPAATMVGGIVTCLATLFCVRELVQRLGNEDRMVRMIFLVPGVRWVCSL